MEMEGVSFKTVSAKSNQDHNNQRPSSIEKLD